ncbi:MAG: hypothetical protein LBC53_02635 [Spirochaetaceae bacterium]|nr:hypothetical protein [Spirochaetaceae bacterium]
MSYNRSICASELCVIGKCDELSDKAIKNNGWRHEILASAASLWENSIKI